MNDTYEAFDDASINSALRRIEHLERRGVATYADHFLAQRLRRQVAEREFEEKEAARK